MSKLKLVPLALLGLLAASCEKAPLVAAPGTTMFLQANPTFVIANGGVSVVTAVLLDASGTFVSDGIEVSFFTDLGRIDPVGKTVNGVARVNFVSDSRSGKATVTAISGAAPTDGNKITISVGSALPARVLVSADPPALTTQRSTRLTATVFDENGNPVQNVPVSFTLDAAVDETLDSGGAFQYTNSSGQVFDTMRTRAAVGLSGASITVTATTANGITGTLSVFIE
jgi:hypothetical protein